MSSKKGLAILMRTRMRPTETSKIAQSPLSNVIDQTLSNSNVNRSNGGVLQHDSNNTERDFDQVRQSMQSAITMHKTEVFDSKLNDFSQGYFSLNYENRRKLLLSLAKEYDLNRMQVRELMKQYLGIELPSSEKIQPDGLEEESMLSSFYHIERNLRQALKPVYEVLFERLNTHPGGLKFLTTIRADILSILTEEKIPSLRALDSYIKEKLGIVLCPASLELHQITWDDPASLLEKIVAYEAVHPISNLIDLKRRLGVGRRCFGYLHPAIPGKFRLSKRLFSQLQIFGEKGEPLIFIEVALLKNVAQSIQEVLWDVPPTAECEATCALFYSISSTQPGLSGINLGKFLIKRVIKLVKRDMPHISTFATLSPIPGFMQWLLSKLASQCKLSEGEVKPDYSEDRFDSTFWENILEPEEEQALMDASTEFTSGKNGMEIMFKLLTSTNHEWTSSDKLLSVLEPPLMRLCARYLLQEKKRGKALDSVANFHLQNGAMIERINWMADRSEKGLCQSAGIMVNYVYRLGSIEDFAQSYFSVGHIHASSDIQHYVKQ